MKILLVGYVKGYQATRFAEEAKKIGVEVVGVYTTALNLIYENQTVEFSLRGSRYRLEEFDLIYLGVSGNKTRWEWYTVCEYLNNKYGTIIVNNKYIAKDYNVFWTAASDYLKQVQNNLPIPKSQFIYNKNSLKYIKANFDFPVIVKIVAPGLSRKGKGVNLVNSFEELKILLENSKDYSEKYILREYIPNDGDIRVFTVGGRVIGAMKRTPKQGDFKSNISQGGSGESYDLSLNPNVKKIAEEFSKVMKLEVAGVDVIINKETGEPYILEINSNPQFQGLETFTNVNAAKAIIEYLVSLKAK